MSSSARYGRNRTRLVTLPSELDMNSTNPLLVHAALAAGLYPKILSIDPKNAQLRTIANNQHTFLHPSSVNFGKNVPDFGGKPSGLLYSYVRYRAHNYPNNI